MSEHHEQLLQTVRSLRAQLESDAGEPLDADTRAELAATLQAVADRLQAPEPGTAPDLETDRTQWQSNLEKTMLSFEGQHPELALNLERLLTILGNMGI